MTNPLTYVPAKVPENCKFKISPSGFSKFIDKPWNWYRDEVLKENPFNGNTSSVIGTIVHYCAHMVAEGSPVDKEAIEEYIDSIELSEVYDPAVVREQYLGMAETLVNDYVLQHEMFEVETQHSWEIEKGYYVAGTIDRLEGDKEDVRLVDYKTYNSKTKPKSIPAHYKYQLLTYARILKEKGYNVTRIRLVYINRNIDGGVSEKTGKALKSYPPEVTVLTEELQGDDIEFIENQLKFSIDSVKLSTEQPNLARFIYHDQRIGEDGKYPETN